MFYSKDYWFRILALNIKKISSNDLYVTLYKYIYSETCAILQLSFPTLDKYLCLYGPKVSLFAKIKPEYSDILYNLTHFLGVSD
jgi:hypothetical protein